MLLLIFNTSFFIQPYPESAICLIISDKKLNFSRQQNIDELK
jgi:hypothetical protein